MIKKEKGATLGIVIVLILFLSAIVFIIMSMATIVHFTVIKNEKVSDTEIKLQVKAQDYLNELTKISYETYFDDNSLENLKLEDFIIKISDDGYEVSYDDDNLIFTFIIKDETINKTLTVEVMFYDYDDVDFNQANPFFKILKWESRSIEVIEQGGK